MGFDIVWVRGLFAISGDDKKTGIRRQYPFVSREFRKIGPLGLQVDQGFYCC